MLNRRLTHSAAVALAFAAITAPTAAAQDWRNPDNRPSPAEHGRAQDLRGPDARDHAEGRGTHNAPDVMVIRVPGAEAAPADGIDWADAGIGAGTALGLSLLFVGGALVAVHRRHSATFDVRT